MSETTLEHFRTVIGRRLGLHIEPSRSEFLESVLVRREAAHGLGPEAYVGTVERDSGEELARLAQDLTVPETYFFRNIEQFRALAETVLPARMVARADERRLRILSAGCASGEEAWSIAMTCQDVVGVGWDVQVLGVDVNRTVLERAAAARYSTWSLRETPADVAARWFQTVGREVTFIDTVRAAVRFEQRNLADDLPDLWRPGAWDVVFFRNVSMYFEPACARAVVARIARSLAPGGTLFLGHAETLRGLSHDFHLRHTHGTFYYERKGTDTPLDEALPQSGAPTVEPTTSWVEAIRDATDRIAALSVTPASPAGSRHAASADTAMARDLMRQERFAEALERVGAADDERSPDVLLLRAVLLAHGSRLPEAEQACATLLAVDELNAGAHYVLALCREGSGNVAEAAERDRYAAYLDPTFAMPRLHLGLLARRAGQLDVARREFAHALALLDREDASRVFLFGGGFRREALIEVCRSGIRACGGRP